MHCKDLAKPEMRGERGAVLATSLLILLVLTLIGMTAMMTSGLEEKMAGNLKDKTLAFQAGEAALRDAEATLDGLGTRPVPVSTCGAPPCAAVWVRNDDDIAGLVTASHSWWQSNARAYSGTLSGVNSQPRYIVEELKYVKGNGSLVRPKAGGTQFYYLITARGTGGSDAAEAVVQSVYAIRFAN